MMGSGQAEVILTLPGAVAFLPEDAVLLQRPPQQGKGAAGEDAQGADEVQGDEAPSERKEKRKVTAFLQQDEEAAAEEDEATSDVSTAVQVLSVVVPQQGVLSERRPSTPIVPIQVTVSFDAVGVLRELHEVATPCTLVLPHQPLLQL